MNELELWQALWNRAHAPAPSVDTEPSAPDDDELAVALERLAELPLRDRAAFARFVPALWADPSVVLRRRALGLLEGSHTPAALRIAIEAIDDDNEGLRTVGLAVLRAAAAERAPLRWCHALFHPRADVRRQAIETLPHASAARMLPWLRADPQHAEHPRVVEARIPPGLARELWVSGRLSAEDTAAAFGQASAQELFALLRGAPQRSEPRVRARLEASGVLVAPEDDSDDRDMLDSWFELWKAAPRQRDAMLQTLVECVDHHRHEPDREPIKRRIAAAARLCFDTDPQCPVVVAALAVGCFVGLLGPTRWVVSAQKQAAVQLHRFVRLRAKAVPGHLPAYLTAPVARTDDGGLDIVVALNLVGWFGAQPFEALDPLVEPPLHALVAATPECWPAVAILPSGEHGVGPFIEAVGAHDPRAGWALIALGLPRWTKTSGRHDDLVERLVGSLSPEAVLEVLTQLAEEHRRTFVRAVAELRGPGAASAWSQDEWSVVHGSIEPYLGDQDVAAGPAVSGAVAWECLEGMSLLQWAVSDGRCLADVIDTARSMEPFAARARFLQVVADMFVHELRQHYGVGIGEPPSRSRAVA